MAPSNSKGDEMKLYISLLKDIATNSGTLAENIGNQNTRISNIEEYLSRFDTLFLLFQKTVIETICGKISDLELQLEKTNKVQTDHLMTLIENYSIQTSVENAAENINTTVSQLSSNNSELGMQSQSNIMQSTLESIEEAAKFLKKKELQQENEKEARKIKRKHMTEWNENLQKRKKRFWHSIQNGNKAKLYTQWAEETPDFLPRKFRPKYISNENPEITKVRVKEAHQKYRFNIEEMEIYAKVHDDKVQEIEQKMSLWTNTLDATQQIKHAVQDQWITDTQRDEAKSLDIWSRKESFLSRKRHEELNSGNFELVDETWSEFISSRKTRKKDCHAHWRQIGVGAPLAPNWTDGAHLNY